MVASLVLEILASKGIVVEITANVLDCLPDYFGVKVAELRRLTLVALCKVVWPECLERLRLGVPEAVVPPVKRVVGLGMITAETIAEHIELFLQCLRLRVCEGKGIVPLLAIRSDLPVKWRDTLPIKRRTAAIVHPRLAAPHHTWNGKIRVLPQFRAEIGRICPHRATFFLKKVVNCVHRPLFVEKPRPIRTRDTILLCDGERHPALVLTVKTKKLDAVCTDVYGPLLKRIVLLLRLRSFRRPDEYRRETTRLQLGDSAIRIFGNFVISPRHLIEVPLEVRRGKACRLVCVLGDDDGRQRPSVLRERHRLVGRPILRQRATRHHQPCRTRGYFCNSLHRCPPCCFRY